MLRKSNRKRKERGASEWEKREKVKGRCEGRK
jgi:hypothetical protein